MHREGSAQAVTIVVVEQDESIRVALCRLLTVEGYHVIEAETLAGVGALLNAPGDPMVLIIGGPDMGGHESTQFFMLVAVNTVTRHAYLYPITMSQRQRLPELVREVVASSVQTGDKSYELAYMLTVVADAAARLHS